MSIFVGRYAGVVSGGGATRTVWEPYFTAAPVILGVLEEGATLAVSFGIAGRPSPSIFIQWSLNWTEIDGATTNALACPEVVGGDVISCTVVLTNSQGATQSTAAVVVESGEGLTVIFGEGVITVTVFGAVDAPSVVFGEGAIIVTAFEEGDASEIVAAFGEGSIAVTAFGAVDNPSVVFGDTAITVNNL